MAKFIRLGVVALVAASTGWTPAFAAKKHHRKPKPDYQEQTGKRNVREQQSVAKEPVSQPKQIQPWGVMPLSAEVEATLKPKDSFKECSNCPEMVVVPAGSFMMGTPPNEVDRSKGEDPVHQVTIAKPFAVGRFAISFDDWDALSRGWRLRRCARQRLWFRARPAACARHSLQRGAELSCVVIEENGPDLSYAE